MNRFIHFSLLKRGCFYSAVRFYSSLPRYFYLFLLVYCLAILTSSATYAQITDCTHCTSNDVRIQRFYLANNLGEPLEANCTPGTAVSAKICTEFQTSATRYGIYYTVVYKVGDKSYTQHYCDGSVSYTGTHRVCIDISYSCGEAVSVESVLFSWGQNRSAGSSLCAQNACSGLAPKCFSQGSGLPAVEAPLIALASFETCVTSSAPLQVNFAGSATGGAAAYTYAWDMNNDNTFEISGQNPVYTFPAAGSYTVNLRVTDNSSPAKTDVHTLLVTVPQKCSMPVSYTLFNAKPSGDGIQLQWQTASEVNNDYFEVERSSNLSDFGVIGFPVRRPSFSLEGLKTYSFTDSEAASGKWYYRLRQVDLDGTVNYSRILSVISGEVEAGLSMVPNPAVNQVKISLRSDLQGRVDLEISDFVGRQLRKWSGDKKNEALFEETVDVQGLVPGIYFATVRLKNQYFIRKFIKR